MKKLILLLALFGLMSCQSGETVLPKSEYVIVDTLDISKNGYGYLVGYEVIIEYDGDLYYAFENADGRLTSMNHRKLNVTTK